MEVDTLRAHPEYKKTSYIGTNPAQLQCDNIKAALCAQMYNNRYIAIDQIGVMLTVRFAKDEVIDVMCQIF